MSSAITRRSRSDSGTSPETIALGQALDDRGLADARLADQHGVVLGAPREHLDHAADLLVAPDHRVELALLGRAGQVGAEALERLVLLLGRLVGDAVRAADLGERGEQAVAVRAGRRSAPRRRARRRRRARAAGARWRRTGRRASRLRARRRAAPRAARRPGRRARPPAPSRARAAPTAPARRPRAPRRPATPSLASTGSDDAAGRVGAGLSAGRGGCRGEQRGEQVRRGDLGVAALFGQPACGGERLLRLDGETVGLHLGPLRGAWGTASGRRRRARAGCRRGRGRARRGRSGAPPRAAAASSTCACSASSSISSMRRCIASISASRSSTRSTPARLSPSSAVISWMRRSLLDVLLRVQARALGRALGLDQPARLVHAQRLRVHVGELGGDRDHEHAAVGLDLDAAHGGRAPAPARRRLVRAHRASPPSPGRRSPRACARRRRVRHAARARVR